MKWLIALPQELVRSSLLLVAFGCAALGLAAWAAWLTPTLDFAGNLAPIALPAALLCGLIWLAGPAPRKPLATGPLALIAVIAWTLLIVPDITQRFLTRRAPAAAETLKVVQFNVYRDDWDHTAQKLDWIRREKPDIVLLEEASGAAAFPLVSALARDYPYQVSCIAGSFICDATIFSRRQPLAQGRSTGQPNQPNFAWARFRGGGGDYAVVALHAHWPIPDGRQPRQLHRLSADIAALKVQDVILGGDFNASGWSHPLQRFDNRSGLVRQTHALPTFPSSRIGKMNLPVSVPILPIDHFYAGGGWKTVSVRRGPDLGSDHYPLVAVFTRGKAEAKPSAQKR